MKSDASYTVTFNRVEWLAFGALLTDAGVVAAMATPVSDVCSDCKEFYKALKEVVVP